VLTVTFGLSYSLLVFAGPLAPFLSYGIATTFITSAVLAAVIGLGSSLPFAIPGPETSTAAMTASSLVERMTAADPSAPLLAPVLITFGMAGIANSIVLCGFGVTRMGRAIRCVPYPVVGGFLGATGCLILLGAIRVITRQRLQLANLDHFANMMTSYELVAACAMALVLYLTWHRSRTPFGLPVILIGGTIGPCRVPSGRHFRGGRTGAGLDLPAAAEGLVDAAVERDGVRPLSLVRAARPRR
jgi:SulP family sulfate permease